MPRIVHLLRSNWLTKLGSLVTTLTGLNIALVYLLSSTGLWTGPYLGLILMGLVGAFVLGLVTIPLGLILYRRGLEARMRVAVGRDISRSMSWLGALTVVNFLLVGLAGSRGASHMSSVEFCGTACHEVMQPEYDTYFDSPHSNVDCVACHVGPGAGWYLKSKLAGARQAWLAVTDSWEPPIPTPVHGMRSAAETCGECHTRTRHVPERLRVFHSFEDGQAEPYTDVVLMKVGGEKADGEVEGIHWHAHPDVEVSFVHTDDARREIPWVQLRRPDGSTHTWALPDVDLETPPEGTRRTMDCIDCHNRPTHRFEELDDAVDGLLLAGDLDPNLPQVVTAAHTVLEAPHTREAADSSIRAELRRFYAELDGAAPDDAALDAAAGALTKSWLRNIYPDRGVGWGAYPSLAGHAGCLRCHDGEHEDAEGEVIPFDCDSCHVVVENQTVDPEILELLGLGEDE